MARLSYQAPGVYVEELPSARQPITGVGTNTAAFIGYIPSDELWQPKLNDDYDPVVARELWEYKKLAKKPPANDKDAARLEYLRAAFAKRQETAEKQVRDLEQKSKTADEKANADKTAQAIRAATEAKNKWDAAKKDRDDLQRQIPAAARPGDGGGAEVGPPVADGGRAGAPRARRAPAAEAGAPVLAAAAPPIAAGAEPAPPVVVPPADGGGGNVAGDRAPEEQEDLEYNDIQPSDDLRIPSRFRPYWLEKFSLDTPAFDTKLCTNFTEYVDHFGSYSAFAAKPENPTDNPSKWRFKPLHPGHHYLTHAVSGFFANGGTRCFVTRIKQADDDSIRRVLSRLSSIDDVAILAAPGLPKKSDVWEPLMDYCEDDAHQNVFAILDSPAVVSEPDEVAHTSQSSAFDVTLFNWKNPDSVMPRDSDHAAYYFPWIEVSDPAKHLQDADPSREIPAKRRGRTYVPPSGHMAGIYARTDEERGVYKAPANAVVRGGLDVKYYVSKPMQELMNPQGVNCIRIMNNAVTVWGARTVGGDLNGEWKYINVRRFAGFLEASLDRGTQWVVFEPNDPGLWSKIILNITAFLTNVWRSGALFGLTAQEAFYVKCDEELNPPEVRDLGQVITEIGVSIVRPAEFVIFRIAQSTAQTKS
jgi:phage tail sheath protein FI